MSRNLSRREYQVAELIAWGAAKKEVPGLLKKLYGGKEISVHTVENILRSIYEKIHLNKARSCLSGGSANITGLTAPCRL